MLSTFCILMTTGLRCFEISNCVRSEFKQQKIIYIVYFPFRCTFHLNIFCPKTVFISLLEIKFTKTEYLGDSFLLVG